MLVLRCVFILLLTVSHNFVKAGQNNEGGAKTNSVDIHLEMRSDSSSLNIKSLVHDEIKTFLSDCKGINKSIEEHSPIAERSTDDEEKLEINSKLNKLGMQVHSIEKLLKDAENKKICSYQENIYVNEGKSLGVQCSSCAKTQNNLSTYPRSCKDVLQRGNKTTGIYEIYPRHGSGPFPVLCDMETRGGGWTHIQKRFDGSQDFFLEWRNYKFGFGDLDGEFWLGLENIHVITDDEPSELLVEIIDRDNVTAYAHFSSFGIGPEKNGYTLDRLSGFSGDAGDSLSHHLSSKFSTKDLDFTNENCATLYLGGWWYKGCHISNLNGKFINVDLPAKLKFKGLHWKTFRSHEYCHSKSRMLVRPAN